jgi:hypothetical protein
LLADQALLIGTYQASKASIVSLKQSFMFLARFISSSGQLTDTDNALALRVIGFVNKVMQQTLSDQAQDADSFAKLQGGFLKVVVTLGRTFGPQAEFCTTSPISCATCTRRPPPPVGIWSPPSSMC